MRNISIFFGFASNLLFLGVSILAIIVLSDDMGLNLMIWDADFVKGISGILISSITALILFFKVYKNRRSEVAINDSNSNVLDADFDSFDLKVNKQSPAFHAWSFICGILQLGFGLYSAVNINLSHIPSGYNLLFFGIIFIACLILSGTSIMYHSIKK